MKRRDRGFKGDKQFFYSNINKLTWIFSKEHYYSKDGSGTYSFEFTGDTLIISGCLIDNITLDFTKCNLKRILVVGSALLGDGEIKIPDNCRLDSTGLFGYTNDYYDENKLDVEDELYDAFIGEFKEPIGINSIGEPVYFNDKGKIVDEEGIIAEEIEKGYKKDIFKQEYLGTFVKPDGQKIGDIRPLAPEDQKPIVFKIDELSFNNPEKKQSLMNLIRKKENYSMGAKDASYGFENKDIISEDMEYTYSLKKEDLGEPSNKDSIVENNDVSPWVVGAAIATAAVLGVKNERKTRRVSVPQPA